jgi:hypothetical protein
MHHLALSLATTATLALFPCSIWYGSSTTPPAASRATGTVATSATASTGAVPSATGIELPVGVRLPAGAVPVGAPLAVVHDGGHSDWRARFRLPTTSASTVLGSLETSLTAAGWHVERGSGDVFAVRRAGTRWELIQILVDTSLSNEFHGSVIDVGIGSRKA